MISVKGPRTLMTTNNLKDPDTNNSSQEEEMRPSTPETISGTVSSASLDEVIAAASTMNLEDYDNNNNNNNSKNNNNNKNSSHHHHHHNNYKMMNGVVAATAQEEEGDEGEEEEYHDANEEDAGTGTLDHASAPSSVCQQRKLSAAIVTSPDAFAHDFVAGRPTMTVEDIHIHNSHSSSTTSTCSNSNSNTNSAVLHLTQSHGSSSTNINNNNSSQNLLETPPSKHSHEKQSKHGIRHHRGVSVSTADINRQSKNRGEELLFSGRNSRGNHSGNDIRNSGSINHKNLTRQSSTPAYSTYTHLLNDPHACRVDGWAESPAPNYHIRSATYMTNRHKEPSRDALFTLLTVDAISTEDDKPILGGLCYHPNERVQRALRREAETGHKELPEFIWAINLAIPGPPFIHIVMYFGCDDIEALKTGDTPIGRLANPFFFGPSDDYRNDTFKLIPRIVEGNFMVKKAVGSKPTILGHKVKLHYIQHPRFLELIVDIGQDPIARNVVALSMGYAKTLVIDLMVLLEGDSEETLPERIMGGCRLKHLDFKKKDGQRKVRNYSS